MKKPLLTLLDTAIETIDALMHEIPKLERDNLFLLEATVQYLKEERKAQVAQLAAWEQSTTRNSDKEN